MIITLLNKAPAVGLELLKITDLKIHYRNSTQRFPTSIYLSVPWTLILCLFGGYYSWCHRCPPCAFTSCRKLGSYLISQKKKKRYLSKKLRMLHQLCLLLWHFVNLKPVFLSFDSIWDVLRILILDCLSCLYY